MRSNVALSALLATAAQALTAAQWESQSIYQIVTDRFARTDGSTTASCNLSQYCGGTWQGIIDHLDYIQGMGFTAVSLHDGWTCARASNREFYSDITS